MRKLHPVGAHERLVRESRFARPDGAVEEGSVHAIGAGRHAVRVSIDGPRRSGLWHLVVDEDGSPERLQARFREEGRVVDVTVTFFEDEALVWRRGAGEPSEAIEIPPGYRLLWPPYTGRGLSLVGLPAVDGPDARMFALVRARSLDEGGLQVRPVKLSIRPAPGGLTLETPGLPDARVEFGPDSELVRWHAEGAVVERLPSGGGASPIRPSGAMIAGSMLGSDSAADNTPGGDPPADGVVNDRPEKGEMGEAS